MSQCSTSRHVCSGWAKWVACPPPGTSDATPRGTSRATRRACAENRLSSVPAIVEDGAADLAQSSPQGFLGPRPAEAQARGQSGCAVASPLGPVSGATQSFEERAGEPGVQEPVHVARRLQRVRRRLVRGSAALPLGRVLQARGDADAHEVSHRLPQACSRHHVERHPRPERVAEHVAGCVPDGVAHRVGHHGRCRGQIGSHRVGAGMAGQIRGDDCVGSRQPFAEGAPEASRLGEAVQQHQWGAVPTHLDTEWHAG